MHCVKISLTLNTHYLSYTYRQGFILMAMQFKYPIQIYPLESKCSLPAELRPDWQKAQSVAVQWNPCHQCVRWHHLPDCYSRRRQPSRLDPTAAPAACWALWKRPLPISTREPGLDLRVVWDPEARLRPSASCHLITGYHFHDWLSKKSNVRMQRRWFKVQLSSHCNLTASFFFHAVANRRVW